MPVVNGEALHDQPQIVLRNPDGVHQVVAENVAEKLVKTVRFLEARDVLPAPPPVSGEATLNLLHVHLVLAQRIVERDVRVTDKDIEEFYTRFEGLCAVLLDDPHMFGYCYTQLTDVEQERASRVCLIGATLRERFFEGANPLGQTIRLANQAARSSISCLESGSANVFMIGLARLPDL